MQPASVAVATDLSTDSQGTHSPIPDPERSRARALLIACLTVALERFGFYVLFSLFTLSLIERDHLREDQASFCFGLLIALAYFTPLYGGPIADRVGRFRTVAVAGIFLSFSYVLLSTNLAIKWFLLVFCIGAGLFKGNITAAVGAMFPNQSERDAAYSRFYLSINLGALPSGVVGAWVVKHHGYRAAFLLCALACLLATALWCSARTLLLDHEGTACEPQHHNASERERLKTIFVLLPIPVLFFFVFHQSGSSLTLFAAHNTHPTLLGVVLDPPSYQSLQAALVIALTPLLTRVWQRWPLATHHKILLGMLLCTASCLVMVAASWLGENHARVSPLWLIGSYVLVSVAELCISPIGFSLVSKLSPPRIVGLLMGLWLAAIAIGNLSVGLIGRYWTEWSHQRFFLVLAAISFLAVPLLLSQRTRLRNILGDSQ